MNIYLDTSVIVAALSNEIATNRVQAWLKVQAPADLVISDCVIVEVSSALGLKLRTGALTENQRSTALSMFNAMVSSNFEVLPLSTRHCLAATRYCDRSELGLRAADALHLAVSADHGATLATLDRTIALAGPPLGLSTQLL